MTRIPGIASYKNDQSEKAVVLPSGISLSRSTERGPSAQGSGEQGSDRSLLQMRTAGSAGEGVQVAARSADTPLVTSEQVTILRDPESLALAKIDADGKVWCKPRGQAWFRMDSGSARRYGEPLTLRTAANRSVYVTELMSRGFSLLLSPDTEASR